MDEIRKTRSYLFNMILLYQEDTCFDLKDEVFKNKIHEETGMSKEYYDELIKEWWGE